MRKLTAGIPTSEVHMFQGILEWTDLPIESPLILDATAFHVFGVGR